MSLTELKQGECGFEPNSLKGEAAFIVKCTDAEKRVRNFQAQEGDCIESNSRKCVELWKKYEEGIELRVLHIKSKTSRKFIKHVMIYNTRSKTYVDMSNGTIRLLPENMCWEVNTCYRTIIIRKEEFMKIIEKRNRYEEKSVVFGSQDSVMLLRSCCNSLFSIIKKLPRGGRREFKSSMFCYREKVSK